MHSAVDEQDALIRVVSPGEGEERNSEADEAIGEVGDSQMGAFFEKTDFLKHFGVGIGW